ncbi:hypothetical protein V8F33_011659 [Rhypophila sp. PSN 637]
MQFNPRDSEVGYALGPILPSTPVAPASSPTAATSPDNGNTSLSSPSSLDARGVIGKRSYLSTYNNCGIVSLGGQLALYCNCRTIAGDWPRTEFILNYCIGNDDGVMRWWRNGGFQSTCTFHTYKASDSQFTATCRKRNGLDESSAVWPNHHIHNYNGALGCDMLVR